MRRTVFLFGLLALTVFAVAGPSSASSFSVLSGPTQINTSDPFTSCTTDNVGSQVGTNYPNTAVEPWVSVNPNDSDHIVAVWQQDRWTNGGSRGLVFTTSTNGGTSWSSPAGLPNVSTCSGNTDGYIRASDPWVSFSPTNGYVYASNLVTKGGITTVLPDSAISVSRSTNQGVSWGNAVYLKQDSGPNILNDKESVTADPTNNNYAYVVWDRLVSPSERAIKPNAFQNAIGFHGPTWFSRTTNTGTSWETARKIFDPGSTNQTIGNQIVVQPDGALFDFFNMILNFKNVMGFGRGFNVSFIKSTDHGATWSKVRITNKISAASVTDPDTGQSVRTEDFTPDVAVDMTGGSTGGNLYAVWQDSRFNGKSEIAFSMSDDDGATWSAPVRINTNSFSSQAFTPSVHVASDGTIGVDFYDFRNNDANPGLKTDNWLIHCHAAAPVDCTDPSNWSETRVTATSFDLENGPQPPGFFLGDYMGLDNQGSDFTSVFMQTGGSTQTSDAYYAKIGL